MRKFCSIGEFEVESEVESLKLWRKAEGESLRVSENVSNPIFWGICRLQVRRASMIMPTIDIYHPLYLLHPSIIFRLLQLPGQLLFWLLFLIFPLLSYILLLWLPLPFFWLPVMIKLLLPPQLSLWPYIPQSFISSLMCHSYFCGHSLYPLFFFFQSSLMSSHAYWRLIFHRYRN